ALLDLPVGRESYADFLTRGFFRMAMFRVAVEDRFPERSAQELWSLVSRERIDAIGGDLLISGGVVPWPLDLQPRRTLIFAESPEFQEAIVARSLAALQRIGAPW
ncbi:MAG TPA: hypothetical protein VIG32_03285, partial [Candidatus Baltobacteraceae bacterium]